MNRHIDFLLLGGGPASVTAADTLRTEGAGGTITIIAAEAELPYSRPSLSKQFLQGKQARSHLTIFSQAHFDRQHISLLPGVRAVAVDPDARIVHTDHAGSFSYGELLIATGSQPRRLGIPGDTLSGVHYLRTLRNAESLKATAANARRAVIVGGSYIGMELAATLVQLDIAVTLITREDMLLDRLRAPTVSAFFLKYFQERGVEILLGDTISAFSGKKKVEGVTTGSGRKLACDMVAVGIGVVPEIDFLDGSGIEVEDGIVVDPYLQTNKPHIFAAGDIASYHDRIFGGRWRLDHWDNAVKQGRQAAKNMLGMKQAYDECSYFFSDVFDLTFEFLGSTKGADKWIERGSLPGKSYALLYLRKNVLQAIFTMGRPPQETKTAESLIRHQVNLGAHKQHLADPDYPLESIPAQTVLILQGGGALGAFECGVVKALEERSIYPDVVAGVSIGAINAALVAGNPRHASAAMESFWNELSLDTPNMPNDDLRRTISSTCALFFGVPQFFRPRWLWSAPEANNPLAAWTSYYDPTPVKDLLLKYVDFPKLKTSPVRLLVTAVNVETAELETFDSYRNEITPDHILASGSLPPGFPWTTVNGKHYWDGGIVSNSPLDQVIEHCGATGKRVYVVDLFPSHRPLPQNMTEVMTRRDEIVYSEKIRKDVRTRNLIRDFRQLAEEVVNAVDPLTAGQIRQRPHYIQLMGDLAPMKITRIVLMEETGSIQGKDYDFSRKTIEGRKRKGYETTIRALK